MFGTYGLEFDVSSVISENDEGKATRQPTSRGRKGGDIPSISSHKSPISGNPPTYQPPNPITASSIPPIANIRLLRNVPPSNDRVESVGTGDGIHFSSSVGIDIKLKLDLAEFVLAALWNLALELDGIG